MVRDGNMQSGLVGLQTSFRSGVPCTPTGGTDVNGDGWINDRAGFLRWARRTTALPGKAPDSG